VKLNGALLGWFAPTGRLIAHGLAGDDLIQVQSDIRLPAELYGGDGNDRLYSASGADLLVGAAGNDLLNGSVGRDLLLGGRGSDKLDGGADDDLLIAGWTAHDNRETALRQILAEWTSPHSYESRVANLQGDAAGPEYGDRRNEMTFLRTGGPEATVFDDDARDWLFGGDGTDWFMVSLRADLAGDLLLDRRNGERVNRTP
jgi:Ca2+-binding RTX toxin-like protein